MAYDFELDLVNQCLENIGEMPLDSLDNSVFPELTLVRGTLKRIKTQILTEGFHCNTTVTMLEPDENGFIWIPDGTLRLECILC